MDTHNTQEDRLLLKETLSLNLFCGFSLPDDVSIFSSKSKKAFVHAISSACMYTNFNFHVFPKDSKEEVLASFNNYFHGEFKKLREDIAPEELASSPCDGAMMLSWDLDDDFFSLATITSENSSLYAEDYHLYLSKEIDDQKFNMLSYYSNSLSEFNGYKFIHELLYNFEVDEGGVLFDRFGKASLLVISKCFEEYSFREKLSNEYDVKLDTHQEDTSHKNLYVLRQYLTKALKRGFNSPMSEDAILLASCILDDAAIRASISDVVSTKSTRKSKLI